MPRPPQVSIPAFPDTPPSTPEINLWTHLLAEAIVSHYRGDLRETQWLFDDSPGDNSAGATSFLRVCEYIDVCPIKVRKWITTAKTKKIKAIKFALMARL